MEGTPEARASSGSGHSQPFQRARYSEERWNSVKDFIRSYYIHENHTREQLQAKLAEIFDFHPSPKMLKTKFAQWDMQKNLTSNRLRDEPNRFSPTKRTMYQRRKRARTRKSLSPDSTTDSTTDSPPIETEPFLFTAVEPLAPLDDYDRDCPYKPNEKKFRFVETFEDGATYHADGLGYREFVALDEYDSVELEDGRQCSSACRCRAQRLFLDDDYAFSVAKSPTDMVITIHDRALLAELRHCLPSNGFSSNDSEYDSFELLRHHSHLKSTFDRSIMTRPSDVVSGLRLLVNDILSNPEVFESFDLERLRSDGHLSTPLWEFFQKQKFNSDIDCLDEAFRAADYDKSQVPGSKTHALDFSTPQMSGLSTTSESCEDRSELGIQLSEASHGKCPRPDSSVSSSPRAFDIPSGVALTPIPDDTSTPEQHMEEPDNCSCRCGISSGFEFGWTVGPTATSKAERLSPPDLQARNDALRKAARFGDLTGVQSLLRAGVNTLNDAMRWAALNDHVAVVHLLVTQGADDFNGGLYLAVLEGHLATIDLLIDAGADNLNHVLRHAANLGELNVIRTLIDAGADDLDTALTWAARAGRHTAVQLLADYGAEAGRLTEEDSEAHQQSVQVVADRRPGGLNIALRKAAAQGSPAAVDLLLSNGADDLNGALCRAAGRGHELVVHLLLDRGAADLNAALFQASSGGYQAIIQLLLDVGASDLNGALSKAASRGHHMLVQHLINAGASNLTCALRWAARKGHQAATKLLVAAGAGNLDDALENAASYGHAEVVQCCLDMGATNVSSTLSLITWLRVSCKSRFAKFVIPVLLRHQAHIKDLDLQFLVAICTGDLATIEECLHKGADMDVYTAVGFPLNLADIVYEPEVFCWLVKHGAECALAQVFQGAKEDDMIAFDKRIRRIRRRNCNRTKLGHIQTLRRFFGAQYLLLQMSAQKSTTKLNQLPERLPTYRDAWKLAIDTMRRLSHGTGPRDVFELLSFLILIKAITETLRLRKGMDFSADFLKGIIELRPLLKEDDVLAYQYGMEDVWGAELLTVHGFSDWRQLEFATLLKKEEYSTEMRSAMLATSYRSALNDLATQASVLVQRSRKYLDLDVFDGDSLSESQRRWQERRRNDGEESIDVPSHCDATAEPHHPAQEDHHRPPDPDTSIESDDAMDINPLGEANDCVIIWATSAILSIILIFLHMLRCCVLGIRPPPAFQSISTPQDRLAMVQTYLKAPKKISMMRVFG